ncbi:2,3-dihydro-2,3-dihydroxybenzoate dehydrogenase [Rhodococcus sp. G-MC3]|uniref:2,3-dihydro-2,3-dihydroxybenzoate dehydrogenase n=1 Tax=Rhodococcus sp. G-MC3 TaxID=3046209 RepID=UPI0024BA7D9F|nr:2,3-dihydro-2,3-dihydroxybenzoate dehydrogenase [Rhodococcus sp. G-MC3]MDJ0392571.1 2,3-dihydro-2,3-dihydroxybenzoate dehydrogenase [Rhodococcus sp. G-MC3]
MTVTLVVGAANGIGRAVAVGLAASGHRLALADVDARGLAETARAAGAPQQPISTHVLDIRDSNAVRSAVSDIESVHGPIGALAHVAGILCTGSVLDSNIEEFRNIFDVNLFGLLNVVQAVGRSMRERRAGSIVVVGSNSAGVPRMSMGAYGSSKAASTMLTRIVGLELAQYGIRANIVAPGSTDTDMQRAMWADPTDDSNARAVIDGDLATYKAGIPLGRIASPEDIADAVEFLLSDRARHITMQSLYVDGGATLRA